LEKNRAFFSAEAALRLHRADAAAFLKERVASREPVDTLVLDPPREGALEIIESLTKLAPSRVVYVSCDVATLARDVGHLLAAGYRVCDLLALDTMPQTARLECVVSLQREGAPL
jgi:23S rRNA (uracil1939-C5)-methyltransferase